MSQIYVNNIPGGETPPDCSLPKEGPLPPFNYPAGSLVRVRQRDWIVLPGSGETLLKIRPVCGSPEEETAVLLGLDKVEQASFLPPDPKAQRGDYLSGRLLRDAFRFSLRDCAGPFRSFGRLNFTPRSYQFVPLMMALRQKTVRLLIADDVGVGKTVEAGLIIRELIDREEIERFSVVCPPHLAPQWEKELREKFRLEAKVVLPSTAARLERGLPPGRSLFDEYPYTIVSIDYIKNQRRRESFLASAPEMIVIDEAHTVSVTAGTGKHQRHRLAKDLCADPSRHILLLTATPHSGKSYAFRSLLSLLRESFENIPEDLTGDSNRHAREQIARYYIQRRRQDIEQFDQKTHFPESLSKDLSWKLTPAYRDLFDCALAYARELISDQTGQERHRRLRWWSALALLRALASSPAAAAATLRHRVENLDLTDEEVEQAGRDAILDIGAEEEDAAGDRTAPGAFPGQSNENAAMLERMAAAADALKGQADPKLLMAAKEIKRLLKDGYSPIVFCRYIATAEYLCGQLRRLLKNTEVISVTGHLPPEERERRIEDLSREPKRVLVCTDCLSEGINLQESFDAAVHYDLSWNPTRHEQREGRVDRFGQKSPKVRRLTIYGGDNGIDGLILKKIIKKYQEIKGDTGVMVPLPARPDEVARAIFKGLDLKGDAPVERTGILPEMEDIYTDWDYDAETMRKNRASIFAQNPIRRQIETLRPELAAVDKSIGTEDEVREFVLNMLRRTHAYIAEKTVPDKEGVTYQVDFSGADRELRRCLPADLASDGVRLRFGAPVGADEELICRTHPLVERLADFVINGALSDAPHAAARRCGAFRTDLVDQITTILLLRCRYHITWTKPQEKGGAIDKEILASDIRFVGFPADEPDWLPEEELAKLLAAKPTDNVEKADAEKWLGIVLGAYNNLCPPLRSLADQWAEQLRDSHQRVRDVETRGSKSVFDCQVRAEEPDWLGVYLLFPSGE
ncbi:MAG: DEAD/DEAH box helicase [Thermoguttaceae bacterium]|nr:DEAD/DEAH box helicase [Thermoguttaceae bacterium]